MRPAPGGVRVVVAVLGARGGEGEGSERPSYLPCQHNPVTDWWPRTRTRPAGWTPRRLDARVHDEAHTWTSSLARPVCCRYRGPTSRKCRHTVGPACGQDSARQSLTRGECLREHCVHCQYFDAACIASSSARAISFINKTIDAVIIRESSRKQGCDPRKKEEGTAWPLCHWLQPFSLAPRERYHQHSPE